MLLHSDFGELRPDPDPVARPSQLCDRRHSPVFRSTRVLVSHTFHPSHPHPSTFSSQPAAKTVFVWVTRSTGRFLVLCVSSPHPHPNPICERASPAGTDRASTAVGRPPNQQEITTNLLRPLGNRMACAWWPCWPAVLRIAGLWSRVAIRVALVGGGQFVEVCGATAGFD